MIRPLIIDDTIRAAAAKVVDYSKHNHYIPGESAEPPGDNPQHVLRIDSGYRCVFSFTALHGKLYRDLSVSLPEGKWPNPFAFYTIASDLFGFTGWNGKTIQPPPDAWMIAKDIHFDAIRVAQEIKE